MSDLDIIRQLEKRLGIEIKEVNENNFSMSGSSFVTDKDKITKLSLYGQQLKEFPPEIIELKNLTDLFLGDNRFSDLPSSISKLKNLTSLSFSSNQFSDLPTSIVKLKNLIWLSLAVNQLSDLPSEIGELQNLTSLYLQSNQLSDLPSEIGELQNLTSLYLAGNQLSKLPSDIAELKNLATLSLVQNPLEDPPIEIAEQGIDAIRKYFEDKKAQGTKKLNQVKVILVGEGGSGKTSLVKQLLKKRFNQNEKTTHGIRIEEKELECNGNKIKANFWDFGGQDIMHATHQFFLSQRSLYILVLDGRKEDVEEDWLKLISNYGGDSPVMIVINKVDDNAGFDLDRTSLLEKYPDTLKGFYRISCKNKTGIKKIEKDLIKELSKVKMIETEWPLNWFRIKDEIEEMNQNFISVGDYNKLNKKYEVDDESRKILTQYLHDLGIILHFKDLHLTNTHVLEPRWATQGVYKIINSKILARKKGTFNFDQLDSVLKKRNKADYFYPADKYPYIVELMRKFELCYDLDDESVLVPDLLPKDQPKFIFDESEALKFRIDYDFFPKSIMPHFIVKRHKEIVEDKDSGSLRWRTGVVLESSDYASKAVVKADRKEKKIYINVVGKYKRDYLFSILSTFRIIHSKFTNFKAEINVCLPDEPNIVVPLIHLLNLENARHKEFLPVGSEKSQNVQELLGTVNPDIGFEEFKSLVKYIATADSKSETGKEFITKWGAGQLLSELFKTFGEIGGI
jgi:internalin A